MKANKFILISCILFLFVSGTAWAGNQVDLSKNSPALLASLDKAGVVLLDDTAAAAIRGQADSPMFVLVKVLGLNTLDYGSGVKWTLNPLGYRYGLFGGYGWTHSENTPYVDSMDELFKKHDFALLNDSQLLSALSGLTNDFSRIWGDMFVSNASEVPSSQVKVFGVSLIGQKFFFGWRSMPYSEYSRREAVWGMKALIFGKSLFPSLGSL